MRGPTMILRMVTCLLRIAVNSDWSFGDYGHEEICGSNGQILRTDAALKQDTHGGTEEPDDVHPAVHADGTERLEDRAGPAHLDDVAGACALGLSSGSITTRAKRRLSAYELEDLLVPVWVFLVIDEMRGAELLSLHELLVRRGRGDDDCARRNCELQRKPMDALSSARGSVGLGGSGHVTYMDTPPVPSTSTVSPAFTGTGPCNAFHAVTAAHLCAYNQVSFQPLR